MSEPTPELVTQLRTLRQRAKISQTQIAEQLGATHSAISSWEHGRNTPGLARAQAWARTLGMELVLVDPVESDLAAQVEYWRGETLRLQGVISRAWAILNEEVA